MTLRYSSTHKLLKQICAYDASIYEPNFERFIRYFFAFTALEDLENHSIDTLYHIARSQWALMAACGPDDIKVQVYNPTLEADGWRSPYTVIQVVLKDIPFLVDSIRMALNRLELHYNLIINVGGMLVKRDDDHAIVSLTRYRGQPVKQGIVESPIFIEVDRCEDELKLQSIKDELERTIHDVWMSVQDWPAMLKNLQESVSELQQTTKHEDEEGLEAIEFLKWLLNDNFTFLGMRDYVMEGKGDQMALKLVDGSGLGVLNDESNSTKERRMTDLPSQIQDLFLSNDTRIIISKTNTLSSVHRRDYTDYIGIKRYNEKYELIGERRFIGLLTSTAYNFNIELTPIVRHKVSYVIDKSRLPRRSHSGKDLSHILATLPRDDLFQATKEDLYHLSMGILGLQERRAVRLFVREDAYGRYLSCFVFVPRDAFNTKLLRDIQRVLMQTFSGIEVSFNTLFSGSILARIHFMIRVDQSKKLKYDVAEIEALLVEACKSWEDLLKERLVEQYGNMDGICLYGRYKQTFSVAYQASFSAKQAVYDIAFVEQLSHKQLEMQVYRPEKCGDHLVKFKIFRKSQTIPLSDALPILENFGFRVLGEEPYELMLQDGQKGFINDFTMTYVYGHLPTLDVIADLLKDAFWAMWFGLAENDQFNHLIIHAQMTWREVSIFRAYTKYVLQLGGLPFSVPYVAETFINNPTVGQLLLKLFKAYFCIEEGASMEEIEVYEKHFAELMDKVQSLDEDRTFRQFYALIKATLRTNYYQNVDLSLQQVLPIAFKISTKDVPNAPLPLPAYEVFVYSPDFEGVHLRMAKVARGGLRWSDRREDFRTEILGLMKAQQVKNAVIVPSGAKGGFVVKKSTLSLTREEVFNEGVRCYQGFIRALLDITDNLVNGKVVHPENVLRRDGDDPYFVVAADKGTATFSDIANQIALEKNFWLKDAFASGGSAGYDHKKMGITARGAWVSAERQFQELGVDVNKTPIKVVGIGDMSGDVFGNGMLLSRHLKVVAAFNHMHIFIDPNPDAEASYQERKRLFDLSRSTWEDYKPELISKGGGVFSRRLKSIDLSPELQQLLGVDDKKMIPTQLISALLKAPVDMIWNGGIGTYIKSSKETHLEVGDRANDVLRIDGRDCRAKVVCEGGNLGLTQLGRVEYEMHGGKVNTDFIDNSAGVDCSDHEVNIKILLNDVMTQSNLDEKTRNQLLVEMTDEVGQLVLRNNYLQNQTLSLAAFFSKQYIDVYRRMIVYLEQSANLNRALEYLPDDDALIDRKSSGLGLTKPELSVLLSYAKIMIEEELVKDADGFLNDPVMQQYAACAFPKTLCEKYGAEIKDHQLYAEIVATQLSNQVIADMGVAFAYTMFDETGAPLSRILCAYMAAQRIFSMDNLYRDIESLDYKVDVQVQYELMIDIIRLVRRGTRWFLRNYQGCENVQILADFFSEHVGQLYRSLPKLLVGSDKERYEKRGEHLIDIGVPVGIAYKVASADTLYHTLNIVEAAKTHGYDYQLFAECYFAIVDRMDLLWFRDLIDQYVNESHWVILGKATYKSDLDLIQRELTVALLKLTQDKEYGDVGSRVKAWISMNAAAFERWESIIARLKTTDQREFPMLTVAIRELSAMIREM
jgi:glutamate dehydrogenase